MKKKLITMLITMFILIMSTTTVYAQITLEATGGISGGLSASITSTNENGNFITLGGPLEQVFGDFSIGAYFKIGEYGLVGPEINIMFGRDEDSDTDYFWFNINGSYIYDFLTKPIILGVNGSVGLDILSTDEARVGLGFSILLRVGYQISEMFKIGLDWGFKFSFVFDKDNNLRYAYNYYLMPVKVFFSVTF